MEGLLRKIREVRRDILLSLLFFDVRYAFGYMYFLLYFPLVILYLLSNNWSLNNLAAVVLSPLGEDLGTGISLNSFNQITLLILVSKILIHLFFAVPLGFILLIYLPSTYLVSRRWEGLYNTLRESLKGRSPPPPTRSHTCSR